MEPLNTNCRGCDHDINSHIDNGSMGWLCLRCWCRRSPADIARDLMADAYAQACEGNIPDDNPYRQARR